MKLPRRNVYAHGQLAVAIRREPRRQPADVDAEYYLAQAFAGFVTDVDLKARAAGRGRPALAAAFVLISRQRGV